MWRNVITRWKRGERWKSRKRKREKRRAVETVTKPLLWYTYISVTSEDEVESTLITGWRTRAGFAFAAVECYQFVGAYRGSIRAWRCRPPPPPSSTDSRMEISTLFRLQFHVASSLCRCNNFRRRGIISSAVNRLSFYVYEPNWNAIRSRAAVAKFWKSFVTTLRARRVIFFMLLIGTSVTLRVCFSLRFTSAANAN